MGWEVFGHGPAPPSWDGAAWPGVPWEPHGASLPLQGGAPYTVFPRGTAATPRLTPRQGPPHLLPAAPAFGHHSRVPMGGVLPEHSPSCTHASQGPWPGCTQRQSPPTEGRVEPHIRSCLWLDGNPEQSARVGPRLPCASMRVDRSAVRGHTGTRALASGRSSAASPLSLGLACVGSTVFQGRNRLRPRARADRWLGWPGAPPAGAWPVSGRPGTIGQMVKAIGCGDAGGRGVCAQSLQARRCSLVSQQRRSNGRSP